MAEATTGAANESTTPEQAALRAMEKRGKIRNAHEAVLLADAAAVLSADRAATETHRRMMLDGHQSPTGDDDMVQIDSPTTTNITNNHPPAPAPAGLGTLGKLAAAGIAAGALSTPIGVGLALPAVIDAMRPDQATAVDTDTDSAYVIRPFEGE